MSSRQFSKTSPAEPAATAVRYFELYEDVASEGNGLAYPCKFNHALGKWQKINVAQEDLLRVYDRFGGNGGKQGDKIQCVWMARSKHWEFVGKTDQQQPPAEGIPLFNADDHTLGSYEVLEVVDAIDIDGVQHLAVAHPTTRFNSKWIVNGVNAIPAWPGFGDPANATGRGSWRTDDGETGPVAVPLDYDGLIVAGDELGLAGNDALTGLGWLQRFRPGFTALGAPYAIGGGLYVDCRQRPVTTVIGKTYVNVSQNQGKNYVEQTPAGDAAIDVEIFYRGEDWIMRPAGWDKIVAKMPFIARKERVYHGTWCKADWYTSHWEGDFACETDDLDNAQAGGGQQQQFAAFAELGAGQADDELLG